MSARERQAVDRFRRDVLEASLSGVVIVRFTASWCQPCRQLAPVIDRAIAAVGDRRVSQVVIDIDENRLIAAEMRIQSVPTVYAFLGGRPVDGFVGARSEREVKLFVEKLVQMLGPDAAEADLEAELEAAAAALASGKAAEAAETLGALAQRFPERPEVAAHYARALLALGNREGARAAMAAIPAEANHPAVQQARAAFELAQTAGETGDPAQLAEQVAANPADLEARFALAQAELGRGNRDRAADALLAIIAAERDWADGKARETLLKLIESVGLGDPWSVATRRRLRQILFA